MNDIIIVGAGGFGREVEWLLRRINQKSGNKWNILGYADDGIELGTSIGNYSVVYKVNDLLSIDRKLNVVIAIGNSITRRRIYDIIKENSMLEFPNIIDPSVIMDDDIIFGIGNIICAGVVATVNVKLENFNIINLNCTLGHDDIIKSFVTIYPNSNISGYVKIDECVEIGTGTQIIQEKAITNNVIIGAGAVVVKDILESGTYVGVPVTRIK